MSNKLSPKESALTQKQPEKLVNKKSFKRFLGKSALVGFILLGPADLVTSDAIAAKTVQIVENDVHVSGNKSINHGIQDAIVGSEIFGESAGLLWFIRRNKKAKGTYDAYKQMKAENKENKKAAKDPSYIPGATNSVVDTNQEEKKNGVARQLFSDLAQVNTIGTTLVGIKETARGNPPSDARIAALSGEITASWIVESEGVRGLARAIGNIPKYGHDIVHDMGVTWNTLSPDFTKPLNPGNFAIGAIAVYLGVQGLKATNYEEAHAGPLETRTALADNPIY